MTSGKVANKSLKWLMISERVRPSQKDAFVSFKSKTIALRNTVNAKADSIPKIDFREYKKVIGDKAFVKKFEKMYAALNIPYPVDKGNVLSTVEQDEKNALIKKKEYVAEVRRSMAKYKHMIGQMKVLVPPMDEMTMQMYYYYFPDTCWDPRIDSQCRMFSPEHDICQPDYSSETYSRNRQERGGFISCAAYELYWQEVFDKQEKKNAETQLKAGKAAAVKAVAAAEQ